MELNLSELKVGDTVSVDDVIPVMYLPVFGPGDEVTFIKLTNVPVAAFI